MSNKILNTYAAYAFDDLIRKQSSSGAIFSLIAEKIFPSVELYMELR